jgi:patatin-like phospholipase/acyl hydrolase
VLCVDGGGYLGLATAAFLRCTEAHFQVRCHDRFDLFVGTSTGGVIALGLASGKSAAEVEKLYLALGSRVFPAQTWPARFLREIRRFFWAKYSSRALRDALNDAFQDKTLNDVSALGKSVAVPALSAATGMPRIFKTNHSALLTRDGDLALADLALATSAAPTYFQAAEVHHARDGASDFLIDGGIFANNPSLIGLVEALSYLEADPGKLQILSISTPRPDLRMPRKKFRWGGGIFGWARPLPDLFINSPSQLVDRAMTELTKKLNIRYKRVALPQARPPLPLDLATPDATSTLIGIGVHLANQNDVRRDLQLFFG